MIQETIALLGYRGTDKITGVSGIITSACFDLYGCVQVVLAPAAKPDGSVDDGRWFDVQRIELSDETPVMAAPDFDAAGGEPADYRKGAADKPIP